MRNERIEYLESLIPLHADIEKFRPSFEKNASYKGNGVYPYLGILYKDTRELFLMTSLKKIKIEYEEI